MALSVTSASWQQVNMPALDLRRYLSAALVEGVVGFNDMAVAQRGAGANMSVDISAGQALIQGDTITNQGLYYAYNDAVFNLSGFSAANATNPRIDRVTLRIRDQFHGDAGNDISFQIVTGTATGGATLTNLNGAAAVPTSQLLLANVLIPATATTITTANIDTAVRTGVFEIAYAQNTSAVTVASTAVATPTDLVVAPSVTFNGTTRVQIEFWAPYYDNNASGSTTRIALYDNGTHLGDLNILQTSAGFIPAGGKTFLTPSAAAHIYKAGAYTAAAGSPVIGAGAGGTTAGAYQPMFIRIARA